MLVLAPTLGQVTPVCYGEGQCILSVYLDDTPTTSVDECNDICQSIDFCQDWTLLIDEGLCFSFADCAEFDTDCENCYSGTRTCGGSFK